MYSSLAGHHSLVVKLTIVGWGIQVDQNMRRAQQRDAVNQARFFFRREVFTPTSSRATSGAASPDITATHDPSSTNGTANGFNNDHHSSRRKQRVMENCFPPPPLPEEGFMSGSVKEEYAEYTMDEIINGRVNIRTLFLRSFFENYCFEQGGEFPGLIGLVETYIGTLDLCELEERKIASYLDLVRRRANGSLKTAATWIRDFVRSHPSYKFDSAVSKEINYDLVVAVDEMWVFCRIFCQRLTQPMRACTLIVNEECAVLPISCPKTTRVARRSLVSCNHIAFLPT